MLRRSKTLSIVMSLCLCLAMLAPVFVAPQTAQAAGAIEYSAGATATVETDSIAQEVNVSIVISIPEAKVFKEAYNYFSIKLPSGVEFDDVAADVELDADPLNIVSGPTPSGKGTVDFAVNNPGAAATGEQTMVVTIDKLKVKSGSGDIKVDITAPSGSVFPSGTVTIGKIVSGGGTNSSVTKVVDMGDKDITLGSITIEELISSIEPGEIIKLKLSKGFKWVTTTGTATGGWNFPATVGTFNRTADKNQELTLTVPPSVANISGAGKIQFDGLEITATNDANYGDVTVTVSSDKDNVTEEDILVARYGDFGVSINEGTKETVTSGRTEQEIGDFTIKESVAGSILGDDRSIKLELPDGVEWIADDDDALSYGPKVEVTDGDFTAPAASAWTVEDSDHQILKLKVTDAMTSDEASTLKIKDAKVKIKPDFEGPIELTISGSAGVEGTVVVAEAVKPVKISAENVKDIIVGQTSQKVADIILTEADKDMILDTTNHKDIVISLEDGYKFTSKPTVTVEEGDLQIDSTKLINEDNDLKLVVKYGSTKASKIRISDVAVTAYRYVPVGPVKAELVGADFKVDNADSQKITGVNGGSTALVDWPTDKSLGSVVIANCVTPAEGASTQFKIGSNVYTVNGVAKIMDVAPYIKNSRTYVPVRYLAYALGVTESNVVWDAATNKVTITKGDKVVELTVGSTTITVNGEAQTMDVAPEITNSRTMLPARFVAEGLGATVGWDAASNTVYVQQ